ncbi:MAG: LTA synthase family protein, partial [Bifidobacterium mongoliense]|nr:LTA synthase family protein [Bifidobacterium mongoliense]
MSAIIPPSAAPLLATLRAWGMHAASGISAVWSRRPRYSYVLYLVVFVLMTLAATLAIQSSVYTEPDYAPDAQVDEATRAAQSVRGQVTAFVTQTWLTQRYPFLLNLLILAVVYAIVIALINRFWVATAIYGTVMAIYAV